MNILELSSKLFGNRKSQFEHYESEFWHLPFLRVFLANFSPNVSVEVGVAEGESTEILSRFSNQVFSIDMDSNCGRKINHLPNVNFINSDSWTALDALANDLRSKVDFCFIDGNHVSEIVYGDFVRASKLISERGIICLHDTYPKSIEYVSEENQWCGSAFKVPDIIRREFPEFDVFTIPIHPGLTLVQKRLTKPLWMNS
jgi:predicted O-methyltransferase YrrM